MIWVLYDTDPKRAEEISTLLMSRYGIEALPYREVEHFLQCIQASATLLVHCDAVKSEFNQLAILRLSGAHDFRFYCTDWKDRTQQVVCIPEEAEKLVS